MAKDPEIIRERGERARLVRKMTDLGIDAFAKFVGVSNRTIKGWEGSQAGGLTEKGAEKLINAAKRHGLHCSIVWLLHGIGPQPILTKETYNKPVLANEFPKDSKSKLCLSDIAKKEMQYFHKVNPGAVTIQIFDDAMEPYFCFGDIVGGQRKVAKNIAAAINKDCIIETEDHQILCRRVTRGSKANLYNLSCINPNTVVDPIVTSNVRLLSAAPVIWMRKIND
jgi:transcriptional regulator with XRE-family HTH domain